MDRNIEVEKLIQEVQVRPAIWDKTHSDYGDRLKRKQNWEKIVNVFVEESATEEEKKEIGELLLKKWKNLRDRYSREVQERKGKSGDGSRKKSPYRYTQQMTFLEETVKHRKNTTLTDGTQRLTQGVDNTEISGLKIEDDRDGPSQLNQPIRKRRRLNPVEESKEDDDRLFLLSLLPTMKYIPDHLKLNARMDMMQAVNKYAEYTSAISPPRQLHHLYEPQPGYLMLPHHEQKTLQPHKVIPFTPPSESMGSSLSDY